MIRLGGVVFDKIEDPRELARAHKRLGYTAAYAPDAALEDARRIAAIRDAFAAEDVVIAEVGVWCNMLAVEPERRKTNQERVRHGLALADELGARCCVDYLGTLAPNSDYGPHPSNLTREGFDLAVQTVRSIIDAVKPKRAKFCLEMMQWVLPDSVDAYLDLLKAVDRPAFGVHVDVVNLVTSPRMYFDTGTMIRDCFKRLGKWVASCHAKDILLRSELAMHFDEARPGLGNLDYRAYLTEIARLPHQPPLMIEHLSTQEEYALAYNYIRSVEKTINDKTSA